MQSGPLLKVTCTLSLQAIDCRSFCSPKCMALVHRYFAEAAATLVCRVFGKRVHRDAAVGVGGFDYWVTDGLYGSMNSVLYDHATLSARALRCPTLPAPARGFAAARASTVFGPTCDGLDVVLQVSSVLTLQSGLSLQ